MEKIKIETLKIETLQKQIKALDNVLENMTNKKWESTDWYHGITDQGSAGNKSTYWRYDSQNRGMSGCCGRWHRYSDC